MDAVCATPRTKKKRQKRGPFTDEQKALMDKWYLYALKVAFDQAHWPYDDHEIRTCAHDALMSAARYFEEGRGCRNFKSFYKHCLLHQLARKYKHRVTRPEVQLDETIEITSHSKSISYETVEFIAYLRQRLPDTQQEVIRQCYEEGMTNRQLAVLWGCCPQNVSHLHRQALRNMRQRACWSFIAPYTGTDASPVVSMTSVFTTHTEALDHPCKTKADRLATQAEICRLGDTGMTYIAIAAQVGAHEQTVNRWLSKQRRIQCDARNQEILQLFDGGMPYQIIAKQLGLCPSTVNSVLHKADRLQATAS